MLRSLSFSDRDWIAGSVNTGQRGPSVLSPCGKHCVAHSARLHTYGYVMKTYCIVRSLYRYIVFVITEETMVKFQNLVYLRMSL
jgi:hypothetical protein